MPDTEFTMEKTFNPQAIEKETYERWEKSGAFIAHRDPAKKPFTIVMPPPNITGQLHMGHAMDGVLQDSLIRYHRMKGDAALWLPGTDHASIATEVKIVDKLRSEGTSKEELGREKFLERAWAWKEEYGGRITRQLRRMGASCDWSRERFTMDEGCSRAVREVFVRLYEKGIIYRGNRLVNWCPCCDTSISDAEVEYEEKEGNFWHLLYPVKETGEFLELATTRPETMLGDTAVAVNPADPRFAHLHGCHVILPLVNREIPIVCDEHADMEKGTGVVKITPAHDPNDFEVGQRHDLPIVRVFTYDGRMTGPADKAAADEIFASGKASVNEKGEPYTIRYDYDYEKYPDTFIVGGNPGNVSKITFEEPFSTSAYMLGADKEYTVTITYTFKEQILPETEGYPEAVFEGTGTPYPYGGGVDGDHTIQWYFDENGLTVDVDAYVPSTLNDWIFTAATIPTEVMTAYLGIEDIEQLFDTSYFYPLNPDGTPSGDWTCSNKPGQWVHADGSAAGWSDGTMYWWYQWGDHKYEGHFTEGLFLVGTNPGNVETAAGQTVTSKAQLGDKLLTVNVHYHAEYPTAKTGKVGPFDYSWTMADNALDIVANVSLAQKDESWAWMGFFINEAWINAKYGVNLSELATALDNFYPVDAAGNKLESWTSYVPGMWFLEDGGPGAWNTGVSFWQYYPRL